MAWLNGVGWSVFVLAISVEGVKGSVEAVEAEGLSQSQSSI